MPTEFVKQPSLLSLVRNPIEFRIQNVEEWGTAAYLILNLYVETEASSGNFELVEEMEAERDQYGGATFDVAPSLEAQLSYFFSNSTSSNLLRCPHLCKRYYVEIGYRTGPEVLVADIYGHGEPGTVNWQEMEKPFKAGRAYYLLLNTTDMALAQQVAFRHVDYYGVETIHGPEGFQVYKDKIYCAFIPPASNWDFVELAFQEIRLPASLQALVYSNFSLLEQSEKKYALLGGWLHTAYPDRSSLVPANRQLLTPAPKTQQAMNGQLQHLYYLPQQDESLIITVRCHWRDGSIARTDYNQGNVTAFIAYRFGLLLKNESLPGNAAGKEFDLVEIEANAQLLMSFERRDISSDYIQEIYYSNSLGGFDTLVCTGFGQEDLESERESAEVYLPEDYRADQAESINYRTEGKIKQRFATGPLRKNEFLAHLGLLLSREVKIKVGNVVVPAVVTTKGLTKNRDGDKLHAFEFELLHAYPYNEIAPVDGELTEAPSDGSLLILNNQYLKVI